MRSHRELFPLFGKRLDAVDDFERQGTVPHALRLSSVGGLGRSHALAVCVNEYVLVAPRARAGRDPEPCLELVTEPAPLEGEQNFGQCIFVWVEMVVVLDRHAIDERQPAALLELVDYDAFGSLDIELEEVDWPDDVLG